MHISQETIDEVRAVSEARELSLSPCPFCGSDAEIIDLDSGRFHVQCSVCPGLLGEIWGTSYSKEILVRLWNRRTK